MADKLSGSRVADEVAPVARFTPLPFWVPMPSLDVQFRILTICDHLPASRENLLNHPFGKDFVGGGERNAVNAGAEGFRGTKGVRGMARSGVNAYSLCPRDWHARQEDQ